LQKKKIVIVGPAYPYRGGNSLYVSSVYNKLIKFFDVSVVNFKLLYPSFLFPGTTQNDLSEKLVYKIPSERMINSINPYTWLKAAKYVKSLNPDLVIFDWWNPFFGPALYTISKLIKSKLKNKILFITENVVSHEGRFIDKTLTKIGIKNSNMFLVLSGIVENQIKEYSKGRKIYRSALPIYDCYITKDNANPSEFKKSLGFSKSDIILLFFGYVRKYKGLRILIDAIPEVIKKKSNVKLLIVGEFYDSSGKYFKQIEDQNLKENVKIIEKFVPNEDVGNYYSISDIVILPYLEGTQSGVLNIAYGFRKPVIVTNVGGLAEDVDEEKTGFITEPENTQALVKAILRYIEIKNEIDFKKNIKDKLSDNEFNKLPELIEKILKDIENVN
jgi:glycosyltransferase involved in cell wall biosynthesis